MRTFSRGISERLTLLACIALIMPAAAAQADHMESEVIIKFTANATELEKAQIRAELRGARVKGWRRIRAELRRIEGLSVEEAIARYQNHPKVSYIEPNYVVHAIGAPNDTSFSQLWGMENTGQTGGTPGADIKATHAWDLFTGSDQVVIGVIDSGVDYTHPDLAANIWVNPGEIPGNNIDDDLNGFVDDVNGWDFRNGDNDPFDDDSHGTHVSGTLGAVGNNGNGVAGVSWTVKIMALKFLSASGSGTISDAIDAVEYATMMGVHLTSNSWGGGGYSQALYDAIADADANGILFVAAAGNSGSNNDASSHYPSNYDLDNVIAVAATDHNDTLAGFSSYGATTVDLAAPGVNILSTVPGATYASFSGTSMATPHVAGALGLIFGRFPLIGHLDARNLILNFADPIPGLSGLVATGGRLNAFLPIANPDDVSPGVIDDLAVTSEGSNWLTIDWTATGDDAEVGTASRYIARYSLSPIDDTNFDSALLAFGSPDPGPVGTPETMTVYGLDFGTLYYFAAKAADEFGNRGPLSNIASGTTLDAPDAEVAPLALSETLLSGATSTQTLTLSNVAPNSTLDFQIVPDLISTLLALEIANLAPTTLRVGDPAIAGSGGPDSFGYRWSDSDGASGPAFNWIDISGTGNGAIFTGDDVNSGPFPIGFSFSYYGAEYANFQVCSNGFLSFTSSSIAYDNQPLPTLSAPANLLAPFWDDLVAGVGHVFYQSDGTRLIVQWDNVDHFNGGGPYTFQLILYDDGTVVYQYLSMGSPNDSATVGIQNALGTDGLEIAFNAGYVHDKLAVRIDGTPQWLAATPPAGMVRGAESTTIDVAFDAAGLLEGTYEGAIEIHSNDPALPILSVPTTLIVIGAPDIDIAPLAFDYGEVLVGATPTTTFVVSNPGTDIINVSDVVFSDFSYTVDMTQFVILARSEQTLTVTYTPTLIGQSPAFMTVHSDDPDEPTFVVSLAGEGVAPPLVDVTPTSIFSELFTGESETRTLFVSNNGASDLEWSVSLESVQAFTLTPPLTETAQEDPDGSVEGHGVGAPLGYRTTSIRADLADLSGLRILWDEFHGQGRTFAWSTILADFTARGAQLKVNSAPITDALLSDTDVLWMTDTTLPWSEAETAALVSWVNTGGSLILEGDNTSTVPIYNQLLTALGAGIVYSETSGAAGTTTNIYPHPTTENILGVYLNGNIAHLTTVTSPAVLLVDDLLGVAAAAASEVGAGRIFALSDEVFRNSHLGVADNQLFGNQMMDWLAGELGFLSVDPTSGVVPVGASATIDVTFDATGLLGGDYASIIHVLTNDPASEVIDVDASLHVTGVPDISASPAVDFGSAFVGYSEQLPVILRNVGTADLDITNIVFFPNQAYSVDMTSFSLPPGEERALMVAFSPDSAALYSSVMIVVSNDPDQHTFGVNVTGGGVLPPSFDVTPTSLFSELFAGESEIHTLTVSNNGASDLEWSVLARVPTRTVAIGEPDADGGSPLQAELADLSGVNILAEGPSIVINRTTLISDFTARGAQLTLNTAPITDALLSGVDILWLTETAISLDAAETAALVSWIKIGGSLLLVGDGIATTLVYNSLLEALGAGIVYFSEIGSRGPSTLIYPHAITENVSSVHFGGPQAKLVNLNAPAVRLVGLPSGAVGLAASQVGAGRIVAAADEIFLDSIIGRDDNRFLGMQVIDWLARSGPIGLSPTSGVLTPGESVTIDVTLDASGLYDRDYASSIEFRTNDPANRVFDVSATLHVTGVPDISASSTVDFGSVYVGYPEPSSVTLANVGSADLDVSNIVFLPDQAYSVDMTSFSIPPESEQTLTVTFSPESAAPYLAAMIVVSNDPDQPTFGVWMAGEGLAAPAFDVTPASLFSDLYAGESEIQTLTVSNNGGSDLEWVVSQKVVTQAFTLTPPLPPTGQQDADGGLVGQDVVADGVVAQVTYRTSPIQAELADLSGVEILWDQSHGQSGTVGWGGIIGDFTARGAQLTVNTAPITVALLSDYDVLWTTDVSLAFGAAETAALVDWINAGGGLILEGDGHITVPIYNQLLTALGAGIVYDSALSSGGITTNIYPHATTENVWGVYLSGNTANLSTVTAPAVLLLDNAIGEASAAVSEVGAGRIFAITDEAFDVSHLGVADNQLFGNQVMGWVAKASGLVSIDPTSGVVPAGGSAEIDVTFDATDRLDGDYASNLLFLTNDPENEEVDVSATLHVTGVPDVTASPSALDFGGVQTGDSELLAVTLANIGRADLEVSNVVFLGSQVYSVDMTGFSLPPGAEQTLTVTFSPDSAAEHPAVMIVVSNDWDQPTFGVWVAGEGLAPPRFDVTPTSLSSDLLTGQSEIQTLTVSNSGGSDLLWSVSRQGVAQTLTLSSIQAELADLTGLEILFEGDRSSSLWSTIIADLTARGAQLADNTAPITDALLSQFDVLWLTATTSTWDAAEIAALVRWTQAGGSLLFEGGDPATVRAYNDLLSALDAGIVYLWNNRSGGTATNIYPHATTENVSGVYFTANSSILSTVIAPAVRLVDDSFGVALGAASQVGVGRIFAITGEVFDNVHVNSADDQLFGNQVMDWLAGSVFLSLSPVSGVVPVGGSAAIDVRFDASGFFGGDYFGGDYAANIRFQTNDPTNEVFDLSATLHVTAAPDIVAIPSALDFGSVVVGYPELLSVTLANIGTDDLDVANILFLGSQAYSVDMTAFRVPPGAEVTLTVTFSPDAGAEYPAVMVVVSNDPDQHLFGVGVAGEGVPPPVIDVTPASLFSDLLTGQSEIQTLTVSNIGGSDLLWSVSLQAEPADLSGVEILWDRSHGQLSDAGWSIMIDDVTARGALVTVNTAPITGALLSGYDVLWTVDSPIAWDTAEIAALVSWVNAGGSLLLEGGHTAVPVHRDLLTALGTGIEYSALADSGGVSASIYPHATTQNVSGIYFINPGAKISSLSAPALRLVDFRGVASVAVSRVGDGRVFAAVAQIFSNFPVESDLADNQLFGNQVMDWLAGPDFLSQSPSSGVVPAGGSVAIDVLFDATDLFDGDYTRVIQVMTNDPANEVIDVPATLHVTGVPDIDASPSALGFGAVVVGSPELLSVTLANIGSADLDVSNIVFFPNLAYSVDRTSFGVPPGAEETLTVTFAPDSAADYPAVMIVVSNDPDQHTFGVWVGGEGVASSSTGLELLAGSDPTDPLSVPLEMVPGLSGGGLLLAAGLLFFTGLALTKEERLRGGGCPGRC